MQLLFPDTQINNSNNMIKISKQFLTVVFGINVVSSSEKKNATIKMNLEFFISFEHMYLHNTLHT